jgi:hypothetical protein
VTGNSYRSARISALATIPVLVLGVLAVVAVSRDSARLGRVASAPPAAHPAPVLAALPVPVVPHVSVTTPPGVPIGTTMRSVPGMVKSGPGWHWNGTAVVIDADNVHLDKLDIFGAVHNTHSGMVITRSRVQCVYERDWCVTMGQGSTLSQDDIGGGANLRSFVPAIGILSGNYRAAIKTNLIQFTNVKYTMHGMRIDGNTTVSFSHIYGMPMGDPGYTTAHTDAIMCTAGQNVFIHDTKIETGNTSTFFVQWETGNVKIGNYYLLRNMFVAITKNNQQSSFGVMIENKGISGPITVRNNLFTHGWQVGPMLITRGTVQSVNRWYPSFKPVNIDYN